MCKNEYLKNCEIFMYDKTWNWIAQIYNVEEKKKICKTEYQRIVGELNNLRKYKLLNLKPKT